MSDELYRLLLVDSDRIFRMGMRSWLFEFPDLEVSADVETAEDALRILREIPEIDLVILDLNLRGDSRDSAPSIGHMGLELCQQLKSQYPHLPLFVLISQSSSELIKIAILYGIDGYCVKGNQPEELVVAIRQVARGGQYLGDRYQNEFSQNVRLVSNVPEQTVMEIVKRSFYRSGVGQIDRLLAEVRLSLSGTNDRISDRISDRLIKIVLAGQVRELQVARWLVRQLWGQTSTPAISQIPLDLSSKMASPDVDIGDRPIKFDRTQKLAEPKHQHNILAIQASLWDKTVTKIQSNLSNWSKTPLEIDILKDNKKRELLYIALRQIEQSLTELRFAQILPSQLEPKIPDILRGIWQETAINFFGKYYAVTSIADIGNEVSNEVNVVDTLLKDCEIIQTEFLNKIPQFDSFLAHLLFETELVVDSTTVSLGSTEAMQRLELILDNVIIQMANAVIQPLLNNFANAEEIKQNFYRYNLLATREIERFRNDLSWKYRLEKYILEPQLIFESRHIFLTFADLGIKKISIYAPRNQELQKLEGVQLAVTLALEIQDAITPRLKSAIALLGSGFVYLLTNVIGRGIGLIGRGVVQGIGNAWQDRPKR
ncbi:MULTISPECIES: DUF3685 domain-containing protein [Pseudanabaena]|uniref:Response regulator receiver protein n=2 Tax=Pseudanabaena TaxID=1152 RepID=L8MRM1_9CYAN|nr:MULTISPECIES: DUF3685 domain-containing protein [Pseudanabaena]ELS30562.1 response regulator receiver protein [Pseudanabaena biceps PCC 7429]MDG3497171.1 DUF3685 domain-containing protein [Pseudanabaena catenata USMAC16]